MTAREIEQLDHWSPIAEMLSVFGFDRLRPDELPSDECVRDFQAAYDEYVRAREAELQRHVEHQPLVARTSLEMSDRVVALAHQLCWYYDELIMPDPIQRIIELPDAPAESILFCKRGLLHNIALLTKLQVPLKMGLVLLRASRDSGERQEEAGSPVPIDPTLIELAVDASRCSLGPLVEQSGGRWQEFRVQLKNAFFGGWQMTLPPGQSTSPPMDIWTTPPSATPAELDRVVSDWRTHLVKLIPIAAKRTLANVEVAASYKAVPLFDQSFDAAVLAIMGGNETLQSRLKESVLPFRLLLPFVGQIDSSRLIEARNSAPASFAALRVELGRLVRACPDNGNDVDAWLHQQAEESIAPKIQQLESDMKKALIAVKYKAIGSPLAIGAGLLCASAVGGLPPALALGTAGGVAAVLNAVGDYKAARAASQHNPYYFLWQARRL